MALRSFGPPSHALVDFHLGRGGTPLHDAVEENSKKSVTTENQGLCAWFNGLRGVCLMIVLALCNNVLTTLSS